MQNLGILEGSWGGVKILSSKVSFEIANSYFSIYFETLKGCDKD